MSRKIKMMTLDDEGNVVDEEEIETVSGDEETDAPVAGGYESFADLYVDAEQQAEESEEPGDDEDEG